MPLLLIVLLALCSCSVTDGLRNQNTDRNWNAHEIMIGDSILSFSLPKNQSQSVPREEVPLSKVSMEELRSVNYNEGMILFDGYWDFGGNFFTQPKGTMTVIIGIGSIESGYDVDDLNSLYEAIYDEQVNSDYEVKRKNKYLKRRGNLDGFIGVPRIPYTIKKIDAREWLHYQQKGGFYRKLTTPIDDHVYLSFMVSHHAEGQAMKDQLNDVAHRLIESVTLN